MVILPIRVPLHGVVDDAQRCRRLRHRDLDGLAAAGAQLPKVIGRDAGGGKNGGRRFPDTEGRLVEGVGPGDRDLTGLRRRHGANGHQLKESAGPICLCHSVSLLTSTACQRPCHG